ncbi:Dabb family protein [Pedobacter sandarakinus]|uniref:Dabb family protein n=1 Tax=Pedobacter sandarakinus TaxID=353156 RepID=UPI002247E8E2|nr:Dabb family protein [Pedobacter sandarakinus]MCX2574488.1 Dabb family protein [Pedobacter sandarakinus]
MPKLLSSEKSFNMEEEIKDQATIQHFVMFWLKPQLSKEEVKKFSNFFESLRPIKEIKSLNYGLAAETPTRPVTDNSFTYALTITFNSLADHNAYQDDKAHLEAVAKFSSYWYRVVVHDTVLS